MKNPRFAIWNGAVLEAHNPVFSLHSRIGHYGDALFETIRCVDQTPLWISYHVERLNRSFKLLGWTPNTSWNVLFWTQQINTLLKKNNLNNARVKIIVYREADGFYLPVNERFEYGITMSELPDSGYRLNSKGLKLGLCPLFLKSHDITSIVKSTSSLLYVQAKVYAEKEGFDEVLLMNHFGRPCEASSSSLFWVTDQVLYTPPLSEYPLNGVMRAVILKVAKEMNLAFSEQPATESVINMAHEMFLSNVIQGIQWVASLNSKPYILGPVTRALVETINKYK